MSKYSKPWTFRDVLDNPETRKEVDAIDDLKSSLQGREDDPTLNGMMDQAIADLKEQTGFTYDPR